MHSSTDGEVLTDRLLAAVTAALRGSRRAELALIETQDLTMSQYKILSLLDCEPRGMGPSEIAQQIGLTPGATSRATEALVRDGLLVRADSTTDRRVRTLALSEAGRAATNPLWSARRESVARLAGGLTEEQRTALSEALLPLVESLQDGVAVAEDEVVQ